MFESDMSWDQRVAIDAAQSERVAFIRKTYLHVAGAIAGFALLLFALVNFVPPETMKTIFFGSRFSWLIVIGVFMGVSFLAHRMADARAPVSMQYLGLGLYTVAEAQLFWPIIWVCTTMPSLHGILPQAVILTLTLAAGLTMSVFITKADFSWMRSALCVAGWVAFGVIIVSMVAGFSLGIFFVVVMIALMCGFILYETSNVLHHYHTSQYVGAALAIFSSLATLFWYVIQLLISLRND